MRRQQQVLGESRVLCARTALNTRERPQLYRAKHTQAAMLKRLARDLLARGVGGSTKLLILNALENKRCKPEELAEIRDLLDQIERNAK